MPGLSAHAQDHRAARSATGAACPWVGMMAKLTLPTATAAGLTVREHVLLYCAASGTDWAACRRHGRPPQHRSPGGLIAAYFRRVFPVEWVRLSNRPAPVSRGTGRYPSPGLAAGAFFCSHGRSDPGQSCPDFPQLVIAVTGRRRWPVSWGTHLKDRTMSLIGDGCDGRSQQAKWGVLR